MCAGWPTMKVVNVIYTYAPVFAGQDHDLVASEDLPLAPRELLRQRLPPDRHCLVLVECNENQTQATRVLLLLLFAIGLGEPVVVRYNHSHSVVECRTFVCCHSRRKRPTSSSIIPSIRALVSLSPLISSQRARTKASAYLSLAT